MRGVAILTVIIQHMCHYLDNRFVFHQLIEMSNMGLFFFISGYVMTSTSNITSWKDVAQFVKKKSVHLMIPFLVWPLVIRRYAFSDVWLPVSLSDIVGEFHNPSLWFLLTLYGYMILGAIYELILSTTKKVYCTIGGGILAVQLHFNDCRMANNE